MEERRREQYKLVSHAEFSQNKKDTDEHRCKVNKQLDDIYVALFAKDSKNINEQPGVMVTMKRLNGHIDNVCNVFTVGCKISVAAASILLFVHQMGWL